MKLISYSTDSLPKVHVGLVKEDEVLDIDLAARATRQEIPDEMLKLIDSFETARPILESLLQKAEGRRFSEVKTFAGVGAVSPLGQVQLAAPIPRPRKNVICLGLNYSEHVEESGQMRGTDTSTPQYPVFFTKSPTTVNGPYGKLQIDPQVSTEIDWETELAVIISKRGKNISPDRALDYVFGYTIMNDVTARDLQNQHRQFFKGKSLDGYGPMGPWIVTADELGDPQQLSIRTRVNTRLKQDGSTSQMIFPVKEIIATLSRGMTLEPGDIIATGTPSGVGFARKPPEFLHPGDLLESEIERIGTLRNPVV